MTQDITLDSSLFVTPVTKEKSCKDSKEALAASLQRLSELADVVAEEEVSASGRGDSSADLQSVVDGIRDVLVRNPAAFDDVLKLIAPHTKTMGKEVLAKLVDAKKALERYNEAVSHVDEKTFKKEFNEHVAPLIRSSLCRSLSGVDQEKSSGPSDTKTDLAEVMVILQMFQMALSQTQIDQDNTQSKIGAASIKAAQENEQNVEQEIAKANAAAEAAAHRPWWETLVEVVVAVVAVCVAAFTAGAGAAVVAVAVGAFMASPGFNDTVTALGSVLTKALESAGMSDSEAKALGDMLAKVIVIVVIAVVSAGIGGIGASSEAAANSAADAAADSAVDAAVDSAASGTVDGAAGGTADSAASATADSTADVAADAAENESSSIMRGIKSFYKSLTKPFDMGARGKIFTFELVSNLATSGVWMDGMEMDPSFVKKHEKLVEGLNILATVLGVIISMIVGAKSFSGLGGGKTILEKFPTLGKGLIPFNFSLQMGNAGMESYLSYARAGFLKTEAEVTREIGESESKVISANATLDFSNDATQINDKAVMGVVKEITDEMNMLCDNSGLIWREATKVLAG